MGAAVRYDAGSVDGKETLYPPRSIPTARRMASVKSTKIFGVLLDGFRRTNPEFTVSPWRSEQKNCSLGTDVSFTETII
jgi:hypothetical protein